MVSQIYIEIRPNRLPYFVVIISCKEAQQIRQEPDHFHLVLLPDSIVSFSPSIITGLALRSIVTRFQTVYWLPYDYRTCAEWDGMAGYALNAVNYIILCPRQYPPRRPPTVGNRNTDYTQPQWQGININHIFATASGTILHELMHILFQQGRYIS